MIFLEDDFAKTFFFVSAKLITFIDNIDRIQVDLDVFDSVLPVIIPSDAICYGRKLKARKSFIKAKIVYTFELDTRLRRSHIDVSKRLVEDVFKTFNADIFVIGA